MKRVVHWIIGGIAALAVVLGVSITSTYRSNDLTPNVDWMSRIEDGKKLTELAIPGSHDCGATHSILDFSGICQDASIAQQLKYGVRFFDLRLKGENDSLNVYHGFIGQDLPFEKVLDDFHSFLTSYPSETLFLSIKEEQKPSDCSKSFDELVCSKLDMNRVCDGLPANLGQARGKIVVLARYANSSIGIPASAGWADPGEAEARNTFDIPVGSLGLNLHVQDHYKLRSSEDKWAEATECFAYASAHADDLTLNFLSGYLVNSFPMAYSISVAKDINPRVEKELPVDAKGIAIMDFVTEALCRKVIEAN